MGDKNFVDLARTPKVVKEMIDMLARNTVHLARLLGSTPYPGPKNR